MAGSLLEDPERALAPLALTLHEAAGMIGAYRWAEERLFALTGHWSADPAMDAEAQVHLFEASAQHAWHADLWGERLPVVDGFDREAAVRPRGAVLEPLLVALEQVTAPTGRLAGLARVVVPELAAAYRYHLGRAAPVTDGPVIRTLHLVLADLDAEEATLDRVLAGAAGMADAGEVVRRLEAVIGAPAGSVAGAAGRARSAGGGPVRLVAWPSEGS